MYKGTRQTASPWPIAFSLGTLLAVRIAPLCHAKLPRCTASWAAVCFMPHVC